jgi:hypothetical protein
MEAQIRLGRIFGRFHISSSPIHAATFEIAGYLFQLFPRRADLYFQDQIDTNETGKQFTFQDFMGVGTSAAFVATLLILLEAPAMRQE